MTTSHITERQPGSDNRELSQSPIEFLFHPTFITSDRDRMAAWLERVFRRKGTFQREFMTDMGGDTAYPTDYSYYIWMSDMYLDVIQPDLFKIAGQPSTLDIPLDRLSELGWSLRDADAVYRAARTNGIRVFDQSGREITSDHVPQGTSLIAPDLVLMWLDPRDAGLGMELAQMSPDIRAFNRDRDFPRFGDDWVHPSVSAHDPLGLVRCSHHTILTRQIDRALRCAIDVLGGRIIHQGENPLLKTRSTYVYLADTVLEYAEVTVGHTALAKEWQPAPATLVGHTQDDIYHAISFEVANLDQAVAHLQAEGVGFEHRSADTVLTDPADCLGMRWGFTEQRIAGDPRDAR